MTKKQKDLTNIVSINWYKLICGAVGLLLGGLVAAIIVTKLIG